MVKKARIAFLEDDSTYAGLIVEWLSSAGFEVKLFTLSLDFLRNFSDAQYDLCLVCIRDRGKHCANRRRFAHLHG